jgi:hypothetical protein
MKAEAGRLAFREEGDFWNAYWAPSLTSLQGALLLGSIRMSSASLGSIKNEFMEVMKNAFAAHVEEVTGRTLEWRKPVRAPKSERSGNA